jgi:uncharacterized protein (TIGR03067 family)
MRSLSGIALSGIVLILAMGCGKKDGAGGTASIEGTWVITGLEFGGEPMPDESITKEPEADRTITITPDKIIKKKNGKDDTTSYTVDRSKTPHHIDMTVTRMNGQDGKMYGIYKLEGDTLTICGTESEKAEDRPKDFKTAKGEQVAIMKLTRKK